jgi:hypothetical protein
VGIADEPVNTAWRHESGTRAGPVMSSPHGSAYLSIAAKLLYRSEQRGCATGRHTEYWQALRLLVKSVGAMWR